MARSYLPLNDNTARLHLMSLANRARVIAARSSGQITELLELHAKAGEFHPGALARKRRGTRLRLVE